MDWLDEQRANFEALGNFSDRILDGLITTVQLTVISGLLGFVIAVVLGLMAGSRSLWLRGPARVLIEFFRGISLLVLLFWLLYVLPLFWIKYDITLPAPQDNTFATAAIALAINYGAYGAEAVRSALTSVPQGQWEATTALSMSWPHKMRRIIFPQAWALMIPSLTNLWVHLLKGSAIVSIVPEVNEFTFELDNLRRPTDIWFSHAFIGLATYFVLALILTLGMQALEARAKHKLGRGPSLWEILSPDPRPTPPDAASAALPRTKAATTRPRAGKETQ
ncbi:ectoine/hydroxyectoine ABC transporter permease subunit EhuC [Nesterenkonia halophila]